MKYIKNREKFLESRELVPSQIKPDALDILSKNDDNQDPELKDTLDKLDHVDVSGKVICRAAPSPTGLMHIGNLRTMLFNYLFAKKHNGIFYLRIEDTDQKRFVEGSEKYIQDALAWVGIEPDYSPWKGGPNGPYRQSERDYTKHTKFLLDNGHAYYAFDSESDIEEARKKYPNFAYDFKTRMSMRNSLSLPPEEVSKLKEGPYVIRFKTPENRTVAFTDIVRGEVSFNTAQTDDKVLVKSNGIPTYHMANVCDDHDMGTTHVIRGEEWLPSTPLHILLYESFGWKAPQFAHLPLLLNPDGKGKLSKRKALSLGFPVFPMGGEGEDDKGKMVQFKGFKDEGYEPNALINFLALLGWNPGDNKEIMTMAEMISSFDLNKVHKAGAKFDIDKAKWFNQSYVSKMDMDELMKHVDFGDTHYSDEKKKQIIILAKERSHFKKDMQSIVDMFTKPLVVPAAEKAKITPDYKTVFTDFVGKDIDWNQESIKQAIFDICAEKNVKMGKVMPGLRSALTGGIQGPDLMTTMDILGKEESKKRIAALL
jgi:nondiscriminating glutamyl-tRNA synthetase